MAEYAYEYILINYFFECLSYLEYLRSCQLHGLVFHSLACGFLAGAYVKCFVVHQNYVGAY